MNNKNMSDYIKEFEALTKDNPVSKSVEYMFMELIENIHIVTERNLDHITGNSQIIGLILDVLENHVHCKKCNKMLVEGAECSCNVK